MFKYVDYQYNQHKNFVKYGVIGISGVFLDFVVFFLLTNFTPIYYIAVNFVSVSMGIINNFVLNICFNFKTKNKIVNRFLSFYAIGMVGLLISSVLLYLLVEWWNINKLLSKLFVIVFVVAIQYSLNKKYSFNK